MNISKREMDAYHATLTRLQGRARSSLERLIQAGLKIKPDMDDAEFIELVNKSMISVTLTYGDAAGSIALDFFDKTSGEHASSTDLANVPMFVNTKYREQIAEFAAHNDIKASEFLEMCGNLLESEVLQQANRTTTNAGSRHGLKFARVPQGNECAFCARLAANGFYFTKEGATRHYHNHCRCKVVAGKPGTQVGGYNPKEYYAKWLEYQEQQKRKQQEQDTDSNQSV